MDTNQKPDRAENTAAALGKVAFFCGVAFAFSASLSGVAKMLSKTAGVSLTVEPAVLAD